MPSGGSKAAVKVGQKLPSKNSIIKNSRRREFFSLPVGHRESPRIKTEEFIAAQRWMNAIINTALARHPSQQAGKAHSLTHNLQTRPTDHHGDSFMGSAGISQRVISSWWTFGRHRAPASLKDGLAVMGIIDSFLSYRAVTQQQ